MPSRAVRRSTKVGVALGTLSIVPIWEVRQKYCAFAGHVLAALPPDRGGFYFRIRSRKNDDEWKLVDDGDHVHPPRRESIGARSEPFGKARGAVCD